MTLMVEESLAEFAALVEAAALQPGEAETTENRGVHGAVKLAAERNGSLVELVCTVGAVALESYQGSAEGDPEVELECITMRVTMATRRAVRELARTW